MVKRSFPLFTLLLIAMITGTNFTGFSQTTIPLYPDTIPNSKPTADEEKSEINKDSVLIISNITRPTLAIYRPDSRKKTNAAVIICPGGGYSVEAAGHEGADVAKRFTEMGVTAFVLKYRIPNDQAMVNKEIGPVQDAQRAIQIVREKSATWGIDKNHIGIMGFSAGGHLASTAGTHFDNTYIANPQNTNLRPDFMVLVYPVISFTDSIGHKGSSDQLIGKNASQERIKEYSNEFHVTAKTPPTFLVHAKDDPVKVQNSLVFEKALKEHGVPVEMYLYEKGGHGYGMNNKTSPVKWMDLVEQWMKKMKFM